MHRASLNSSQGQTGRLFKPACLRLDNGYQRDFVKERFAPSSFGRASLTVRLRPSRFLPSRAAIARFAFRSAAHGDESKSA